VRAALLALALLGCGGPARHIPPPALPDARAVHRDSPPPKALQHYALAVISWQRGELEQAQEHVGIAQLFDPHAPALHLLEGRIALERGELEQARQALVTSIHLEPQAAEPRLALARVLEIQGEYPAAIRQLETLLEHQPNQQAFADLCQLSLLTGQREAAAQVHQTWLETEPERDVIRLRRAMLSLELDLPHEAWADLAWLLEHDGATGPALDLLMQATERSRRYGSTLSLLRRATDWEPGNQDLLVRLGGLAEQVGDHELAVEAWERLQVQRGGADGEIELMRAEALLAAGQAPEALEAALRAAELEPHSTGLVVVQARALVAMDRLEPALRLVERDEDWRGDASTLKLHAELLRDAGALERARESLEAAAALAPLALDISLELARLEARTDRLDRALERILDLPPALVPPPRQQLERARLMQLAEEPERALLTLERAETRWPDEVDLPLARGQILLDLARLDEARQVAERALERFPEHALLLRQLALNALRREDVATARALLRRALSAHPDHAHLLNDLAYLEAEAGERGDEVLAMARRAVDQRPASGAFLDTLGWILWRRGERAEALPLLERAARLSPEVPEIQRHLREASAAGAAERHGTR
jgi:tetratricopeptide (TPR) repeat protein